MYFNIKKTNQYKVIRLSRNPLIRFNKQLKILFFISSIGLLALSSQAVWKNAISNASWEKLLGGGILSLCFVVVLLEIDTFFNTRFKHPKLSHSLGNLIERPTEFNAASFLDYTAVKVYLKANKLAKKHNLSQPSASMFTYAFSTTKTRVLRFVFHRAGIKFNELKQASQKEFPITSEKLAVTDFSKIVIDAALFAKERGKDRVSVGDLLVAVCSTSKFFENFLNDRKLAKQDIENLFLWYEKLNDFRMDRIRFWDYDNLIRKGSIARDFSSGYSLSLNRFSVDMRERFRSGMFREIIGHKKEIKQLERVLEKSQLNNVLLVGQPGTGRGSIVEAVAQKAFLGESVPSVNYKRFLEFDLTALVAEATTQEKVESALEECFREVAKAGNVIIVIKDFENFVETQVKPGAINIIGILSRYLTSKNFQIIAITSYAGLHMNIEKSPALLRLFEKVEVDEISEKETLFFIENHVPFFEKKHKKFITYKSLREIVNLSSRYLGDIPFPDRALRLLDEAMAYLVTYTKDYSLTEKHIQKIVSEKAQVPVGEAEEEEKKVLLNLEQLIHQRLINQETAVKEMSSALRRARAEVSVKSGPIGSFLFLGPTGVGKTEAAKTLSAIYFKSVERMIRLDMSEFQNSEDVKRFLGGEGAEGMLTTAVRENPFSLVLLDELEKAHPNILTLFLQVLDEGWLTDGLGRKVDFKNTIVIATSNAGAELIRQKVQQGSGTGLVKDELVDYLLKEGIYRPEFINRFDAVVVFGPLSKEHLFDIAGLKLNKLAKGLLNKGIKLEITPELKQKIVELSYKPEFGAREMNRVIQDRVENVLARAMLSGELQRGHRVALDSNTFSLIINNIRE
ncbi:MAG: ATP-dependent Clp protease ATP-binding subunit [Parcubacteria group bacterium]|nr:ATP-dependent Clp protease ATP-binding subunit [Parcubacteria group bacterium]